MSVIMISGKREFVSRSFIFFSYILSTWRLRRQAVRAYRHIRNIHSICVYVLITVDFISGASKRSI
jgi:hypothetical protein